MGNDIKIKIKRILASLENLPYFTLADLSSIEKNKHYLKILFSRYEKSGKLIRLKKGVYVTERYLLGHNGINHYHEFLANILYQPSYLSLDYILYQHNLLTELPKNFTSVAKNKTARFANKLGNFFYHKIKDDLFRGFDILKEGDFTIMKATKAKALFDFLYLRKNFLTNEKAIEELRLNLGEITRKDLKEFKEYLKLENSKKMKEIFATLYKLWKR
ncbi:MAG: hypothetical protein PHW62_04100 [Candidatus Ratteibacteria bacterium]|nr:hypothetical protein [Candidatus Ratteibacteria bacterium]